MSVFLFFAVSAILLLSLSEVVEIEYIYDGKMNYVISFSVFELTLYGTEKRRSKKRKSRLRRLRTLPYLKPAIDYSLSHSHININRIYTVGTDTTVFKNSVTSHGLYSAAAAFAVAYLEAKAGKITRREEAVSFDTSDTDTRTYDISITQKIPLFHLLSSLFISFFGYFKKRIKDGERIGRQ